jgi:hypothetical protein
MATSSFNRKFEIKTPEARKNYEHALQNAKELKATIDVQEERKKAETALKCLFSR